VTIHSDHPFLPPEGERDPLRRFRGRMIAPVSVWTAYAGERRVGWTVSSMLVVDGPQPTLLGLLDPDADLTEAAVPGGAAWSPSACLAGSTGTCLTPSPVWRRRRAVRSGSVTGSRPRTARC
jgi:hypothetical protein